MEIQSLDLKSFISAPSPLKAAAVLQDLEKYVYKVWLLVVFQIARWLGLGRGDNKSSDMTSFTALVLNV